MAKSRQPAPVALTEWQRERLERLWFVYGNYGSKTTPGNHQFIQGLLEHGIDIRPLQTKRTAKRDVPTAECVSAVEAVLAREDGGEGAAGVRLLQLVPPRDDDRGPEADPDQELRALLREMRGRMEALREADAPDAGGKDAA